MKIVTFIVWSMFLSGAYAAESKSEALEKFDSSAGFNYNYASSSDFTDERVQTNLKDLNVDPILQEMFKKAKAACRLPVLPTSITLSAGVISATWNLDKLCHQ